MNLAVSNIGWSEEHDTKAYELMKKHGFTGVEIAPTRIFPQEPYDKIDEASLWEHTLDEKYGFCVPSMQSIWFGRGEKLFGTVEERQVLVEYTKKAIEFAEAINCKNLVFGCPKNRVMPQGGDPNIAITFFEMIGEYALEHGTVIGMEANPVIYNTNYINNTKLALDLIKKVDSKGFLLNLDVGTMIHNEESVDILSNNVKYINHVHISEPMLKPIREREIHIKLKDKLLAEGYKGFISIEMGRVEDMSILEERMNYVKRIYK